MAGDIQQNPPNSGLFFPMDYQDMPSSRRENLDGGDTDLVDIDKAFQDLIWACRIGDTETADTLTLIPNIDINGVDEWDYSPLILASLCGHLKIVELLLSRGAICDRDTFQGARCIYGALNDEIRNLLLSYDITKQVDDNQPFLAHLSKLLAPVMVLLSGRDIAILFPSSLSTPKRVFVVNRFLLAARSSYLKGKLEENGPWNLEPIISMDDISDPNAFEAIIDYIYLRTDAVPLENIPPQLPEIARKLELDDLCMALESMGGDEKKAVLKQRAQLGFVESARRDMKKFLEKDIISNALVKPLEEEIDLEDIDSADFLESDELEHLLHSSALPDVILSSIDLESDSVIYYPVHRAMLNRADFFATMFRSEFFQATREHIPTKSSVDGVAVDTFIDRPKLSPDNVPVLQASFNVTQRNVTETILSFLYHDDSVAVDAAIAVDVLVAAEELCIDRLKSLSAVSITSNIDKFLLEQLEALPQKVNYDVFEMIEISWQTRSERLEQHMTKLLAHNIEALCEDEHNRQKVLLLIRKSAQSIKERQETDTIELIDDMRYYLAKKYAVYDEFTNLEGVGRGLNPNMAEPEDNRTFKAALLDHGHDVAIIDSLLDELSLEA